MTVIVDYGAGNLRSVQKALESLGERALVTSDAEEIERADRVVLPGVGAFAAGMRGLERAGLIEPVKRAAKSGRPFLGICLGMQMLLEESAEGGGAKGLGLLPGRVKKFEVDLKIPHMGWNSLTFREDGLFRGLSRGENFYFVHSYYCETEEPYVLAETEYGIPFVSAVRCGRLYGVQFHPEKSGAAGLALLKNFVELTSV